MAIPPPDFGLPRRSLGERLRSLLVGLITASVVAVAVGVYAPDLVPGPVAGALGLRPEPLGRPPAVGGTGSYRFLATQRGDRTRPVAYDPCRQLHVRINTDQGPPGARRIVLGAMDTIEEATGLDLVYDGPSTERPHWEGVRKPFGLGADDPVLVTFATEDAVPQLAGRVAGIGGSSLRTDRRGRSRYVTGQVTLDVDSVDRILRGRDGEALVRAIVVHELGHVVGLDHVEDPAELMYAENLGRTELGTGDRIGLAALGRGPCS